MCPLLFCIVFWWGGGWGWGWWCGGGWWLSPCSLSALAVLLRHMSWRRPDWNISKIIAGTFPSWAFPETKEVYSPGKWLYRGLGWKMFRVPVPELLCAQVVKVTICSIPKSSPSFLCTSCPSLGSHLSCFEKLPFMYWPLIISKFLSPSKTLGMSLKYHNL